MKSTSLNIKIDDHMRFHFGNQILPYSLYFMDLDPQSSSSNAGTFKKCILREWASAVKECSSDFGALFLPFLPDDQWTECFKATYEGDNVVLRLVRTHTAGYQIDFGDLRGFITSNHALLDESPEIIGAYVKAEFISALLEAEIVDDVTSTASENIHE